MPQRYKRIVFVEIHLFYEYKGALNQFLFVVIISMPEDP